MEVQRPGAAVGDADRHDQVVPRQDGDPAPHAWPTELEHGPLRARGERERQAQRAVDAAGPARPQRDVTLYQRMVFALIRAFCTDMPRYQSILLRLSHRLASY